MHRNKINYSLRATAQLFSAFCLLALIGCDPTWSVLINGKKKQIIPSETPCRIEISAFTSHAYKYYFTLRPLDADLTITDLPAFLEKIISKNSAFESYYVEEQTQQVIIPKDKTLKFNLYINIFGDSVSRQANQIQELIIPPNEYLICNGHYVVADTIKYNLNTGKIRILNR